MIVPPGPEEGAGEAARLRGRVRPRARSRARQRAHRELAAHAQREHEGPAAGRARPSSDFQRDGTGDRHVIVVDPVNGMLHEFWQARRTDAGWQALAAATFDLQTGALRPERWTSSDAAGLPIFPAVVRYDECERGMVEHAMRFTVRRTRRAYVLPATHWASQHKDPNLPRMGERFRLRKRLRRLRLPAARPGHPEGPQEVRHVRGRQRQRLAGCRSRPTAASRPGGAAPREGLGLRGRGDGGADGGGRVGRRHEALPDRLRRARRELATGPSQRRYAAEHPDSSSPAAATSTPARAERLSRRVRLRARVHGPGGDARRRAAGRRGRWSCPWSATVGVARADPGARRPAAAGEAARAHRGRGRPPDRRGRTDRRRACRTRSPSTGASPRSCASCAARLDALGRPAALQHLHYEMTRVDRRDPDFSTTAIHGLDAVRFLAGATTPRRASATASCPRSARASPTSSWTPCMTIGRHRAPRVLPGGGRPGGARHRRTRATTRSSSTCRCGAAFDSPGPPRSTSRGAGCVAELDRRACRRRSGALRARRLLSASTAAFLDALAAGRAAVAEPARVAPIGGDRASTSAQRRREFQA